jgi:hypothetical protein
MAKARSSLTIYDKAGRPVANLTFRKECTPELWLKPGYSYLPKENQ